MTTPPPPAPVEPIDTLATPADEGWHRLHPATPLVKGWIALVAVLLVLASQAADLLMPDFEDDAEGHANPLNQAFDYIGWILLGLGVLLVLIVAYTYCYWRFARYRLDDEAFHLHTGVIFRQRRSMRLDRLEAVDTVRPLVARLVGLAELKLQSAGGSGSGVNLAYIKYAEATALREQLLAGARRVKGGADQAVGETQAAQATSAAVAVPGVPLSGGPTAVPAATPSALFGDDEFKDAPPLVTVGADRIMGSLLLSMTTWWVLVCLIGLVVLGIVLKQPEIIFMVIPGLLGVFQFFWQRIAGEWSFTVTPTTTGLRLTHGLFTTVTQNVPQDRIQAIQLSQTLLWRARGWWRVTMNVAGYGVDNPNQVRNQVLAPVVTEQEIQAVLWSVLPQLAGPQAWELVTGALNGEGETPGFITAPPKAKVLDPIVWRRRGFAAIPEALFIRNGRLWRTAVIVPHGRIQAIGVRQGPWMRLLGLANVKAYSTPGPVSARVVHLAVDDAARLAFGAGLQARLARGDVN
ncbi:MAG: PH domain-containing protein [Bifidobacteriaceae bacterium]|jgi:putative membrane protein|nr:PH domain-containing protein [Bifidobacteriaceae bacterium]